MSRQALSYVARRARYDHHPTLYRIQSNKFTQSNKLMGNNMFTQEQQAHGEQQADNEIKAEKYNKNKLTYKQ